MLEKKSSLSALFMLGFVALIATSCSTNALQLTPNKNDTPTHVESNKLSGNPNVSSALSPTFSPSSKPVASTTSSPTASDVAAISQTPIVLSKIPKIESRSLELALASGKPTLADFGSTSCVPCKEMKATLEELDPLYRDRVNILIVLIDYAENQELYQRNKIINIPTQIFFDASGKPVFNHIGVLTKAEIVAQFKNMGID